MSDTIYPPTPVDEDCERDGRLCDLADCGDWLVVGYGFDPEDAQLVKEDWQAFCAAGKWPAFRFRVRGLFVEGKFVGTRIIPAKRRNGPSPLKRIAPRPGEVMTPASDVKEYLHSQTEHKRWGEK